jgi:hypothetical protein
MGNVKFLLKSHLIALLLDLFPVALDSVLAVLESSIDTIVFQGGKDHPKYYKSIKLHN